MAEAIDARTLKAWLSDGGELALLDVREHGQFGEAHLFFAVPLPYSRFEAGLPGLVPNTGVRIVLYSDGTDGVAARAARRAEAMGYRRVHILAGGTQAWRDAGYTLYAGVNVPSKTFGELVEHQRHTPRISAQALEAMRAAGEDFVIVDGRPFAEYQKMSIPGGVCCPNGELVLRIGDLAPSPKTKIVVNCAGRTRSIIGAQILIDFGIPNPVYALENGTQGWFLAGLELERDAKRRHGDRVRAADVPRLQERARSFAQARGVTFVAPTEVRAWLADASRTTYLLDVRSPEESSARPIQPFVPAPGGQLLQATDQWVGVRGARLVLADDEDVRALVIAGWLRQLGYEASVLAGGLAAAAEVAWPQRAAVQLPASLPTLSPQDLALAMRESGVQVIDLRPGMTYRKEHIAGAVWSIRPRIAGSVADKGKPVVLVADEPALAAMAALDLAEAGVRDVRMLAGSFAGWQAAGLPVVATPDEPSDAECIDFLFFTAARHDGNAEAARAYLAWEVGLLDQLDEQERGVFRIAPSA